LELSAPAGATGSDSFDEHSWGEVGEWFLLASRVWRTRMLTIPDNARQSPTAKNHLAWDFSGTEVGTKQGRQGLKSGRTADCFCYINTNGAWPE
jgi:hypothetical protein